MTHDEIERMPAGREMDAMVAEKVMGLKVSKASEILELWQASPSGASYAFIYGIGKDEMCVAGANSLSTIVPRYSTEIGAAWGVIEKAFDVEPDHKSGFPAVVRWNDGWRVTLLNGDGTPMDLAYGGKLLLSIADTAPLAICRAALKAVV